MFVCPDYGADIFGSSNVNLVTFFRYSNDAYPTYCLVLYWSLQFLSVNVMFALFLQFDEIIRLTENTTQSGVVWLQEVWFYFVF